MCRSLLGSVPCRLYAINIQKERHSSLNYAHIQKGSHYYAHIQKGSHYYAHIQKGILDIKN